MNTAKAHFTDNCLIRTHHCYGQFALSLGCEKALKFSLIGGRSGIIWILIFMIPVVFASVIHDTYKNSDSWSTKTSDTCWLNDFLKGNLVSFCILWCSNLCFIQTCYHHSFCLGMEFFCNWTLSTRLLEKQADCQPRLHELYRGVQGHVPRENFWKLDSRKSHILHSLDRTQLIHTRILLSFSQSFVIHDSRAEVQRFMIPEFLNQRFMILTCFVTMIHDSWFRFYPDSLNSTPPGQPINTDTFYDPLMLSVRVNGEWTPPDTPLIWILSIVLSCSVSVLTGNEPPRTPH